MADLINPYANPYLPSFVSQRPRVNNVPNVINPVFNQIKSVSGFEGARAYATNNLAPGSSEIISESDPNIARVYVVAKDQSGQIIADGYALLKETEPKPVTMDDLNTKMSELLERMNKLEEDRNNGHKPGDESVWKTQRQSANTRTQPDNRNGANIDQSAGSNSTNVPK